MRYSILGHTGLRVSALVLGTGNFGTGWGHGTEPAESRAIFDAYRAAGGNFVDTANIYQRGESETLVGEFIAAERNDIVLATKFGLNGGRETGLQAAGNSRKVLVQSLERSLQRLATDRVELLWVHCPDGVTPIDEIARALDDIVRSGKALHVGLSNFPAWRIATSVTIAELRGWAPVQAVQTEYSLVERTAERELVPMAGGFGLAMLGWSPLGGGLLTGKYRRGETGRREHLKVAFHDEVDSRTTAILDTLLAIASEMNVTPAEIAVAWVLAKGIRPILGPRTRLQFDTTLGALQIKLEHSQRLRLDEVSAPSLGSPHEKFQLAAIKGQLTGDLVDEMIWPETALR
ncbi:MAG: putative oxidoreductase, aryl-alcohol dehydrogenase like protein [Gammaproteobacteria bacterium]|jgi:aryl-alcohol dehydrogenase-like predicted oxidoreductase|nr:putative oxidoreductase, aryl-alcohol dehydrogenase like protein [Gammaproteobacteria bacterium]